MCSSLSYSYLFVILYVVLHLLPDLVISYTCLYYQLIFIFLQPLSLLTCRIQTGAL